MGRHKSHRGVLGKRKSHRKFLKKFRQFQRERFNRSTPERIDVWNENWKKNFFPKYENPILKELGVNITEEHGETIFNNLKNIKQKMEEQLKRTEDLLPDFLSDFNEENGCKLTFKMLKNSVKKESQYSDIAEKFWDYMSDRTKIKRLLLKSLHSFNEEKGYELTFEMLKDGVSDESEYRDIAEEFGNYIYERHSLDYLLSLFLNDFNFEKDFEEKDKLAFWMLGADKTSEYYDMVEEFWNYVKLTGKNTLEGLDINKLRESITVFNREGLNIGDLQEIDYINKLKEIDYINKILKLDDMDYAFYSSLPLFIEIVEKLINEFDSTAPEVLFEFVFISLENKFKETVITDFEGEIICRIFDFVYAIVSEDHKKEIFNYLNSLEFGNYGIETFDESCYSEAHEDVSKAMQHVDTEIKYLTAIWNENDTLHNSYVFFSAIFNAANALFKNLFEKHSEELEKLVPDKNEPDSYEPDSYEPDSYENYKDKLDKLINKFISEFNNTPDIDINPEQNQQEIPPMETDHSELGAK